MYKNILIPIDGSECSIYALKEGIVFAKNVDANITFLCAIEDPMSVGYGAPEIVVSSADFYDTAKQKGSESLTTAKQLGTEAGINIKTRLIEKKHPATAILEAEEEFDLVIMGTHGRRGIRRFFMGSVTEEVIRRATKPYMVIPMQTE